MLFREHVLSDVLPHLHNKNDNAHKLLFTSSQNSTFSLKGSPQVCCMDVTFKGLDDSPIEK